MIMSTATHQSATRGRSRWLEKLTISKSFKSERGSHYPLRHLKFRKSPQQLVHLLVENRLKSPHSCLGKEGIDSCSANTMFIMVIARGNRFRKAKLSGEPLPSVALLSAASVEHLVED